MSISTKWIVITGAPASGKTSVINRLEANGYHVVHEVARAYFDKLMHKNIDIQKHRSGQTVQQKILSLKKARERYLETKKRIFFDRGMPDSLAYFRMHGIKNHFTAEDFCSHRYDKVFYLEPLPFVQDEVRTETIALAEKLDQLIYEAYLECHYQPIKVPVMSIEDRQQFILEHCRDSL